jgi:6-phosphofructokinase 1
VVEVMGRNAGWIAIYSGIAGGADVILIPEKPFDLAEVAETIKRRHDRGRYFSIVVVAEGARLSNQVVEQERRKLDQFGHTRLGGIGNLLAAELEKRTGFETRAVVLGHTQRGGTPTAFDRVLATRYGVAAITLAHEGRFGLMVALKGNDIRAVPIAEAVAGTRYVPPELVEVATALSEYQPEGAYKG